MEDLLTTKLHNAFSVRNDLNMWRALRATRRLFLDGLDHGRSRMESYVAGTKGAQHFLRDLRFESGLDSEGTGGWTPLRYACMAGYYSIVEELLLLGGDPNIPAEEMTSWSGAGFARSTVLHTTVIFCRGPTLRPTLEKLLLHRADPEAVCGSSKKSVLACALASEHPAAVRHWLELLPGDWDLSRKESNLGGGLRLIGSAALLGDGTEQHALVRKLLEAGPLEPTVASPVAFLLLYCVMGPDNVGILDLLREHDVPLPVNARLPEAARQIKPFDQFGHGRLGGLRHLEGLTALSVAAVAGKVQIAKWLLAQRADPSLKNVSGMRAVDFAKRNGFANSIGTLLAGE